LEREVVSPGWVSHDQFLAGYGAAQALPGPLFAFSAYVGCLATPLAQTGTGAPAAPAAANWVGGMWTLCGIFLPGLLLVAGTLPFWQKLRRQAGAQAALRGANAAVVGVLLAAFYNPVWINGITNGRSFAIAATTFVALQSSKIPVWAVVVGAALWGGWWL
jgi:chromate transporter